MQVLLQAILVFALGLSTAAKANSASEVDLFGNKFTLPTGCVLYPRPSLIDGYIRFRCAESYESASLTIVFLEAERCDADVDSKYQTLHQYSSQGIKAFIVAKDMPQGVGQIFSGQAFDEETCLIVTGDDFERVNNLVKSALGK